MIVKRLKIEGFRNIRSRNLEFHPGKNLIHGRNGAGKTSLIESMFLAAFGKSFLNVRLSDMIPRRDTVFDFQLNVDHRRNPREIHCFSQGRSLTLELDGHRAQTAEIRDVFYPTFFSSATFMQEIESVSHLRRMMNRFICGVDPLYIRYILSYNQALKQKNHLLRLRPHAVEITGWNQVMIEMGTRIVTTRQKFIGELNREIRDLGKAEMNVVYLPSVSINAEGGRNAFQDELHRVREIESRYQRAVVGPHRDRFDFQRDHIALRYHSSGEKKLYLLLAYIAFIRLFQRVNREYPVFLVDDYDTAMDQENVQVFMDAYPDMQVIATSVNPNDRFDHQVELTREN